MTGCSPAKVAEAFVRYQQRLQNPKAWQDIAHVWEQVAAEEESDSEAQYHIRLAG